MPVVIHSYKFPPAWKTFPVGVSRSGEIPGIFSEFETSFADEDVGSKKWNNVLKVER